MFTSGRCGPAERGWPAVVWGLPGIVILGGLLAFAPTRPAFANCAADKACGNQLDFLLKAEQAADGGKVIAPPQASGLKISIGDETFSGDLPPGSPELLGNVDIQVKYDGLDVSRQLAVSIVPERHTIQENSPVAFHADWNYGEWIERAELRIYHKIDKASPKAVATPVETLPVDEQGNAYWLPPHGNGDADELVYTLRVYDAAGRFDETFPLALRLSDNEGRFVSSRKHQEGNDGEDRTAISNIPINGGKVTVYGRNIPAGYGVQVLGKPVDVDNEGSFVTATILRSGEHVVGVTVRKPEEGGNAGKGLVIERDISIPASDWFYVGIADVTIGKRFGKDSNLLTPAAPGEYDSVYRKGRLAFYLKGKIQGRYLITAAMDTSERELGSLFTNLDGKDPKQLLRRLDPDDYYAVYGDDSTTIEDAPTSGKFYIRIEEGKNKVMWGNFRTSFNGVELVRFDRGLYGASVELRSNATTSSNETAGSVSAFAAQPGTLPQRDEFRGTGGSVYFLRRQDVTIGSEQLFIEERDSVTGLVVVRKSLRTGTDYEMDYIQGIVILADPLASTVSSTSAVSSPSLSGNENHLVVNYGYTPASGDVGGYSYGGRAQVWLNDHMRIGVTGISENTGLAEQFLYGADLVLRYSPKTYFEFEWARSQGDGFGFVTSTDGGFVFDTTGSQPTNSGTANSWRTKAVLDLADISNGAIRGSIGVHYQQGDKGYNAPGKSLTNDERIWGAFAEIGNDETTKLALRYDEVARGDGSRKRESSAEIHHRLNERWSVTLGARHSLVEGSTGSDGNGSRTDTGIRVDHKLSDTLNTWVIGQVTAARDGNRDRNDRIGIGAEKHFTDKVTGSAEVSYGTSGIGLLGSLGYAPTASDRYHIGYRLTPDTTAGDLDAYNPFTSDYGAVVFGATRKLSESLAMQSEENYDLIGSQRSMTHTYGLTYTPEPEWKLRGSVEAGEIRDSQNGDFNRVAASGAVGYKDDGRSASLRLEARFEKGLSSNARDRNTFLIATKAGLDYSQDWRFVTSLDAAISQSGQDTILDGDYIEGSIGFAYRPVDNDRLNALFKYTYLHDLPGAQQVNAQNVDNGPRQRSHIVSADFDYALNERLSIGGKYGMRIGEVSMDRSNDNFTRSSAQLGIARADFHIVKEWDILVEGRALWLSDPQQINFGALAGVYRHVGDNMKLGVGYNFGRFSDDLSDLVMDDQGVFVNVIGKF
ncbi:MAG: TonB-dependent receptor [Nitratireductor sp.]